MEEKSRSSSAVLGLALISIVAFGFYGLGSGITRNADGPRTFSKAQMEDFRKSAGPNVCYYAVEDYILGGMTVYNGELSWPTTDRESAQIEGNTIVAWTATYDDEHGIREWMCKWDPAVKVMSGSGRNELELGISIDRIVEIRQISPVERVWDCTDPTRSQFERCR